MGTAIGIVAAVLKEVRAAIASGVLVVGIVSAGMPVAEADHEPPPVDLQVDTFSDTFDGSCADGDCSLRDAVASASPGQTIGMPSGLFVLTLSGPGGVGSGDLDIDRDLAIVGIGQTGTFIDATGIGDRAFEISNATVSLERLTIFAGTIDDRGAGVSIVEDANASLHLITMQGGHARNGGGVAVTDATLELQGSVLLDTVADRRGGGVFVQGTSSADVTGSTIAGAQASSGGAVWTGASGTVNVNRSTIARNEATTGGGIRATDGETRVHRVTIARNEATIGAALVGDAPIRISGSAIALNRSASSTPCIGAFVSGGTNVGTRGTASCGLVRRGDQVVRDLRLGPLASHGGPTPTISLLPSSPAVDAGNDCREADQRGARRDGACDAGAYELVRCAGVLVNVVGTRHDDELSGGRPDDGLLGQAGDDELQGSIGADGMCGGHGSDRLLGGPGDDRIIGSSGDDRLLGEDGDDRLHGGAGWNTLIGGPGRDVCLVSRRDDRTRSCEVIRRIR